MARYIGNPLTLGSFGGGECIVMTPAERARHMLVVGATGTGKSLEDCARQDILAQPRSGCGMLVLDPHGPLNDGILKWAAGENLENWPIVPLDLRRRDWTISYNPLRRRATVLEESVVAGNFVRSIMHAWGQSDANATPRLAKWLEVLLYTLHTNNLTMAEAMVVLASPAIRRSLVDAIEDTIYQSVWHMAPSKEADFQEMVESTVSRVRKFLIRRVMRAALGQSDVSLDLGTALEEGQIILATVAVEGGNIDEEDASTFGSLLLSDLWMAAQCRGKREEGGVRPFYVYLDEFQRFVTPSMAESLDQASGFGLHMTFAHQFPSQLLKSDQGKQLYDSVMANCRSKVAFQVEHNADLEELTLMLYRQMVDLRKVKHKLYSTKVLSHELKYMDSYSNGVNHSNGGGETVSRMKGDSLTVGTNWSHTDGENDSVTVTDGTAESDSVTETENDSDTDGTSVSLLENHGASRGVTETDGTTWGKNRGEASGESITDGENWSKSRGRSVGDSVTDGTTFGSAEGRNEGQTSNKSTTRSQSTALGKPTAALQAELGELWSGELSDDESEKFKRERGQSIAITQGESDGDAKSAAKSVVRSAGGSRALARTATTSDAESDGGSRALARSRTSSEGDSEGGSHATGTIVNTSDGRGLTVGANAAHTHGTAVAVGKTIGTTHTEGTTHGTSTADTVGGNENRGVTTAETRGNNTTWADGTTHAVTSGPMLLPVYGKELSSVTFESVADQLFGFAQLLSGQKDRHCVVKIVSKPPVAVRTLDVRPARTTDEWAAEWVTMIVAALPFAVPLDQALLRITERHRTLTARLLEVRGEPSATGIPIAVKSLPAGGEGKGPPPAKDMRRV